VEDWRICIAYHVLDYGQIRRLFHSAKFHVPSTGRMAAADRNKPGEVQRTRVSQLDSAPLFRSKVVKACADEIHVRTFGKKRRDRVQMRRNSICRM
jgi:hypothetical protein